MACSERIAHPETPQAAARFRGYKPLWSILALATISAGCGATETPALVFPPFTAEHEPYFDNGVDLVADPEALGDSGAWLEDWESELQHRVETADVVALVTVSTFRTDVDLDRRETYRLIAHPDRLYFGQLADDIALVTREGEAGYGTVGGNERRFLDRQFFAFIKYQTADDESVRARWHLSMATAEVSARVRRLLSSRVDDDDPSEGGRHRVIVHRN